ncbi:MAG: endo-1,4-beta-xylanase [Tepidisphaeraceae bacterium]
MLYFERARSLRFWGLLSLFATALPLAWTTGAHAQTVNGNAFVMRSTGAASGTDWTLSSNGYLGTYIQVPAAGGQVTFTVNADGTQSGSVWPDMTVSVAGENTSFSVSSTNPNNYVATLNLPGDSNSNANGTYAVRLQLDNQNASATPALTVNTLNVSGATVVNSNTSTLAMDASQTYIDKFRQGQMNVTLLGPGSVPVAQGTPVQVKLVSNSFSLGSAVYDTSESGGFYNTYPWMTATSSSTGNGALAYDYQQFLLNNFTTVEPENAGKWSSEQNSPSQSPNMTFVDQLSNYAEAHNLNVRMHNLIAASQQPSYVTSLFGAGGSLTPANKATLNGYITSRIGYYVSGNNAQPGSANGAPRTLAYQQMDVLNEALNGDSAPTNYIEGLGYSGVANVYSQVANAVANAGAHTRLYTNEYNVLQNSADAYSNWYLNEIQSLNNAAGSQVVSGVGSELYCTTSPLVPSTMQQTLQNLAVTGLPLTLTEFGIATNTSAANAATDLQNAFTMIYGDPNATTFDVWDFWATLEANDSFLKGYEAGALMNTSGSPTSLYTNTLLPMLQADGYTIPGNITPMNLTVGANGLVNFTGAYGTYKVTVDGQNYSLTYSPTGTSMTLMNVPQPTLTWNNTGGTGDGATWDTTSQNWNNGSSVITYGDGANVIFNDSNNSNYAVTLNTTVQPSSVVINNSLGNYTFSGSGGIAGTGSLTKSGSGTATLSTVNTYSGGTTVTAGTLIIGVNGALPANGNVAINGTSVMQLASNTGLATLSSLTIASGATLDITNNQIIINYTSGSDPIATIAGYLATGCAGGAWNGPGIDSSTAALPANSNYGLGYADSADPNNPAGLATDQIEIEYTLLGDATLSGTVTGADFTILVTNLGKLVSGWDQGDFLYTGTVTGADFTALVANLGKQANGGSVALPAADWAAVDAFAAANGLMADVPEPASVSGLALAGVALLKRKPRRASPG